MVPGTWYMVLIVAPGPLVILGSLMVSRLSCVPVGPLEGPGTHCGSQAPLWLPGPIVDPRRLHGPELLCGPQTPFVVPGPPSNKDPILTSRLLCGPQALCTPQATLSSRAPLRSPAPLWSMHPLVVPGPCCGPVPWPPFSLRALL